MKTLFSSKTIIALAVAVAAAAGYQSLANEQPIPPPATASDSVLPANVPLGSPVGQVFKLVQAGVDISVIQNYISNCPTAFNLDADSIIALTDAGLPGDIVNAIYAHDKALPPAAVPVAPVAAPEQAAAPVATNAENSPPPPAPNGPPADLNVGEVSQTLSPYGVWVNVDGYGRCWRPNVVVYDATWRPYCDRGRWVYTDCGWYWDSDYAWGVTFHYGRWFNSAQYGWCWWPDTVWAPSWVTWRSANDYCGWAPLPPYTVYQPGVGFCYRGGNVSLNFSFGLTPNCYTFVSFGNFCRPHPRYYCFPQSHVTQIYNQTTIINNYNCRDKTIVNNGVSVTVIGDAAHRPIKPVPIGNLVNGGHHGWHGQNINSPGRHFGSDASDGSNGHQFTGAAPRGDKDSSSVTTTGSSSHHNQRESFAAAHDANKEQHPAQTATTVVNHRDQRDQRGSALNARNVNPTSPPAPQPAPTVQASVNNPAPVTVTTPNRPQNNRPDNAREPRQTVRQYTPPVASAPVSAPSVRTIPQNNPVAATRPTVRPEFREQPRQVVTQPRYVAPVAPVAPPVVVERPQPRSEPRQNIVQPAPRYVAPSAPTMPAPAQNQMRTGNSANGMAAPAGRIQSWMAQNR